MAGKNAIITGAGGGIGLETTILFLRQGANVLMTDISEPALEKALAKVKDHLHSSAATGRVETAKVDVSKESEVQAAVEKLDSWGGIDIMFNNAGIMHGDDAGGNDLETSMTTAVDMADSICRRCGYLGEDLGPDTEH